MRMHSVRSMITILCLSTITPNQVLGTSQVETLTKCAELSQRLCFVSVPVLRRDQLREVYKEKLSRILTKNANEQLETIHRQEEERKQLRKRKNYYMAKETGQNPQYSLQRTDDVVTFWSYRARRNANHRRNNDFTKPQEDKLDVQFE